MSDTTAFTTRHVIILACMHMLIACGSSELPEGAAARQTPAAPQRAAAPVSSSNDEPATPSAADAQELLERLAQGLSRSTEGLTWVDAGGGVRSMNLHGRFAHATLAVRGADGVVRQRCVDRLSSARAALGVSERGAP